MTTIRAAKAEDLGRLMEIEALTFPPVEQAARETFSYRLHYLGSWFFAAEEAGQIVGLINGRTTPLSAICDELYEPAELPEGRWLALLCVETDPRWQRQGVARTLIKAFIQKARQEGLLGVTLACKDALIPYYTSFGFRHMGVSVSVHGGAVWNDMRLDFTS